MPEPTPESRRFEMARQLDKASLEGVARSVGIIPPVSVTTFSAIEKRYEDPLGHHTKATSSLTVVVRHPLTLRFTLYLPLS